MNFPTRLKKLRLEHKLTQEQLGKKINVTKVSISGYENGTRTPDIETLQKIAEVFDVTIDFLLGRTDQSGVVQSENTFSKNLKRLRIKQNLTLKELATKAKMDHERLADLESGKIDPDLNDIIDLSEALDAPEHVVSKGTVFEISPEKLEQNRKELQAKFDLISHKLKDASKQAYVEVDFNERDIKVIRQALKRVIDLGVINQGLFDLYNKFNEALKNPELIPEDLLDKKENKKEDPE
ncbi:XRE family transcriptional regulator [Desmospora sp. 8437]|nr:XRE family transcriptional regulator [Desmospora sp. 8437]